MWTPLQRKPSGSASSASGIPSRRIDQQRHSSNKPNPREMPRLTSSVSGPSTVGVRAFPLQPNTDHSFRSDISMLSTHSAQERKSWFCDSCSYRNGDMLHTNCALCGCAREVSKSPSGRKTIFTIDSSISLVSRPEGIALSSHTTCSRTTGTSISTKVVSNTTTNRNNKRRWRPRTQDDQEVVQPPTVSHAAQTEEYSDDDDVSIASQDTCRRGSLSSSHDSSSSLNSPPLHHPSKLNAEASRCDNYSSSNESASESSDSSRRRAMPHDDPIEQPSSFVPRRRRRQASEDLDCDSPTKPVRVSEEALQLSPLPSSTKKGRKKKSIKDYIPGLRRRRRRSSATASTAASSIVAAPSSKMEIPSNHTTPLYNELDLEEEPSFHGQPHHHQFVISCGAQSVVPRSGFRAVPAPGLYD